MDRVKIKRKLFFLYSALWILLLLALYLAYCVYFVDTTSTKSKWVGLFAGAISLLLATCKICEISYYSSKNPSLEKISKYFTNGAVLFVKRLSKILFFVFLISSILLKTMGLGFITCYLCGGLFAYLTIFLSTIVTSKTATRSSQFYAETNGTALKQLHFSGVSISCFMVSFVIIPLTILFHIFKDYQVINGFILGAVVVGILNNVSTVVSKQAVDSAGDVVENFVGEINKNDRRNPLLLLNGITKTILGVNVLASDLFVSFAAILIASMTVGGEFLQLMGIFLPLIIAGSGIFASVIVALLTNAEKSKNPVKTMFFSMLASNILLIAISCFLIKIWLPDLMQLVFPIAIGAFGGYLICFAHSNLIFSKYKPVLNVTNAAISGLSPTLRQVAKEGFSGVFAPAIIFAFSIIFSFLLSDGINEPSMGLYGILLAILSSVTSVGLMLGINTFGLTTSTVDTVLETYEEDLYDNAYPQHNILSSTGEFIVSLGKNYINALAILSTIAVIIAYTILALLDEVDILNPYVLGSVLLGASAPFLYLTCTLGMVSKTAKRLVLEVKKQIKDFPQIVRYELRPNYENCVDISALNGGVQVIINTLLIILIMALIIIKLNTEAICGFVFGALISVFGLIFFTSGNSLVIKNAKKYFEGRYGNNRNSGEYSAIISSEEFYSSMKDVIVPTLNILIKFMAIIMMTLVPLFVK